MCDELINSIFADRGVMIYFLPGFPEGVLLIRRLSYIRNLSLVIIMGLWFFFPWCSGGALYIMGRCFCSFAPKLLPYSLMLALELLA
jgi:hypothetical protein